MLPIRMKIGSTQLRITPIDNIQTIHPERALVFAELIVVSSFL
jgi:hypothetical protein